MQTLAGTRLGRYEVLEELGRGAMGVVYKALDPKIDRLVAIKTISLPDQDCEDERTFRERFFVEAKAAGRLSHRGIVQVFDVGEEPNTRAPFIVMELVDGESLNRLMARHGGKLPVETALRLAHELAEALAFAHGQGVVHRDIKPSNILVARDGHAKIADFGVAKLDVSTVTMPGQLVGTPAYMAPEQLTSSAVDGRADLFSLSVILYSMVSGHRPFQGNGSTTIRFKVIHRNPVPVTAFDLELSSDLNTVVARGIAKDPDQRYQTGTEMAFDLQCLLDGKEPLAARATQVPEPVPQPADSGSDNPVETPDIPIATEPAPPVGTAVTQAPRPELSMRRFRLWAMVAVAAGALVFVGFHLNKPAEVSGAPAQPIVVSNTVTGQTGSAAASITGHETAAVSGAPASGVVASPKPVQVRTNSKPVVRNQVVESAALVSSVHKSTADTVAKEKEPVLSSTLALAIEYPFDEVQISVWVDDHLAYSDSLRGDERKRLGLFRSVEGKHSHAVRIRAGDHRVRVRTVSAADAYDESRLISATFVQDAEKVLHIRCDKRRKDLQLRLE